MKQRTLDINVSVWYRPEDKHIHIKIRSQNEDLLSTISADQSKKRGHPHLFNHLKKVLEEAEMWERKNSK